MKWFEGGIPQAIQAAKQNNSVFIVFVSNDDEKSKEMEACLHSDQVTKVCEENNAVAIKIAGNSNDCTFFSQIYPVVVIPSTFFIGNTGVPLEVIGEVASQDDFLAKAEKAVQPQASGSAGASPSPPAQPDKSEASASTSQQQTRSEPEPTLGATAADVAADPAEDTGSGDDSVPEKKAKVDKAGSESDLASRVEKAKELVELKRQEKQQKEADDEKRREQERRTMGRGVQQLRQQQKDREMLESKMELKKDREEDKLARERVKEQIARDRAERAAKFSREKEERDQAREEARKKKLLEEQAAQQAELARRSDTARLQFRRPDGSSVTQQFPATATLAEVHSFIAQDMGSPALTLSISFPRRTFTSDDQAKSLRELGLAPSAALMVMPRGGLSTGAVRGSGGSLSLSSLTGYLLAPVWLVWNIVASLLGLSGSNSGSSGRAQGGGTATSATGGDRDRGSAMRRTGGSASRQEGAIHRLRNPQDDEEDDENNTWNGNSTQQM